MKRNWGPTLQTNLAVYHYSYKNLQIPISVIRTGGLVASSATSFYNAPKSRSQGLELEVTWQPINNLQLIFNYSYIDATIRSGQAVDVVDPTASARGARPLLSLAQCRAGGAPAAGDCAADAFTAGLPGGGFQRVQNLKGNRLPNAPENKLAFAANYTWEFEAGSLTGSASYSWRDKTYGTLVTRWYTEAPSWDQVDARVLWRPTSRKYEIIAYVKNIFDDVGYDQGATGERLAGSFSNIYGPNPAQR